MAKEDEGQRLDRIATSLAASVLQPASASTGLPGVTTSDDGYAVLSPLQTLPLGPASLRARYWLGAVAELRKILVLRHSSMTSAAASSSDDGLKVPQQHFPLGTSSRVQLQHALVVLAATESTGAEGGLSADTAMQLRQEAALCLGELGAQFFDVGEDDSFQVGGNSAGIPSSSVTGPSIKVSGKLCRVAMVSCICNECSVVLCAGSGHANAWGVFA